MNSPVIKVKGLTVYLGKQKVLNSIDFEIAKGEMVSVIGPNGSGKTTLAKSILGLIPYQGEILVFGQNPGKALYKIGYVPQKFQFDRTFPITVCEFLELSHRKNRPEARHKALKEVEMEKMHRQRLGELSGGQLQRILIARALINSPEILILDEPTAGIDMAGEKGFYEIIKNLNEKHQVTIVLISHEISMIYHFSKKVICLNKDLVCFGEPKEAITKKTLDKLYGGQSGYREHFHN